MPIPNEVFSDITNFLPNDDITDLMLMSWNFNALVTPRLRRIVQAATTVPTPAQLMDDQWFQQNVKKFLPIGTQISLF
ncbi:hypothetical protein DdX_14651 [Ditylenchus destructor]|uniref:F-box domain-containing protein n=1 Tax=Ditylenchus destructor TaxID=166010 RepID=A0AAD4MWE6_9BILA|nr:hypothetical protein DdX_14651 [Ditylenchus destructor]